ncbi:MAG: PEP-CTERM sorting domain-containing protein [Pseudomonadota bacterium]
MTFRIPSLVAAAALVVAGSAHAQLVFSSDFESSPPAALNPGTALLTGVQGYAGLGPAGNVFGGQFLRSATANKVTLTLAGLPTHDALSVQFLFAAIDSLDGTGSFPSGDYFRIDIDGVTRFRESFANATDSQIQSYAAPAGVELARKLDLGFGGPGGFYRDSAYDLGADPSFQQFAHSGSGVTIEFWMEGVGLQSLDDESWAMDNLRVTAFNATTPPIPEPSTYALMLGGLGVTAWLARRRRTR